MQKRVVLIEKDHDELDVMKHAIGEIDSTLQCMSFAYADGVVPALTNAVKPFPEYIFLDVDMPRKSVTDLLAGLYPMKAAYDCKIVVFASVMPKRVAYVYRVMGASYAFQKPATREGYREIFLRILGKENDVTLISARS